jgi:hypothetical protein
MRRLYEVFVVDPEEDEVISQELLIAKSGSSAKIKALSKAGLSDDIDYDDLDVIVVQLGDVRDKKEVQEVKILKE